MYITLARNLDNIRSYQHHAAIRSILRWTVDSNTVGIFVQQRDNNSPVMIMMMTSLPADNSNTQQNVRGD